jgi:5-methylcytosine-specific restriction enzyme A
MPQHRGGASVTILYACTICAALTPERRCPQHRRTPWQASKRRSHTISGWEQQRRARRVMERHFGMCHVCGQFGSDEIDHVIPLSQGGADDESNLRPIHSVPCHREKTTGEAQKGRAI